MNILVTGGLGFIGSNLAKYYYALGNDVEVLTRSLTKKQNLNGYKDINIKLRDIKYILKEDVENKDIIFHCASTVDNYNIHDNPYLDVDVNCTGTIALLEACKEHNPDVLIVYPSTFFVNGNPENFPVSDQNKENPLGLYGATKLCAENILKTYQRVFGIKSKIVRLSNVFGPGEQHDNNKKAAFNRIVYDMVHDKTVKIYNGGEIKRDYIYIEDVITAIEIVTQKGKLGTEQIYYVGLGMPTRFIDLVNSIISIAHAGKIEFIDSPPFHKAVGIDDFWCDVTPLKKLGWIPRCTVQMGIRELVVRYNMEIAEALLCR
jgi:nucleoside-diphosphate-sugar epimerase